MTTSTTTTTTTMSTPSQLLKDWHLVRTRAYKKILSMLHQHSSGRHPLAFGRLGGWERSKRRTLDLPLLLDLACQQPTMPCIRVCLVLMAHIESSVGKERQPRSTIYHRSSSRQYVTIGQMCWRRYQQDIYHSNPMWLRMYSEWMVECAYFDHHRTECWDVLRPLAQSVLRATSTTGLPHEIFCCLAHVLSRRGGLLQQDDDDIHTEYREVLTKLMVTFGEAKFWIRDTMTIAEQERMLQTLQWIGVLGYFDVEQQSMIGQTYNDMADTCNRGIHGGDTGSDIPELSGLTLSEHQAEDDSNGDQGYDHSMERIKEITANHDFPSAHAQEVASVIATWPFSVPYDLRSALERIGSEITSDFTEPILSSTVQDTDSFSLHLKSNTTGKNQKKQQQQQQPKQPTPPMLDYLNQDLLRIIFSFLGFKHLLRSRNVCTTFKSLSDETNWLWFGAYQSQFELLPSSVDSKAIPSTANWKDLFIDKYLMERSIRFQRHSQTGWKYRTCAYVGCMDILKTSKRQEQHYHVHVRTEIKEREREERRRQQEEIKLQKQREREAKALLREEMKLIKDLEREAEEHRRRTTRKREEGSRNKKPFVDVQKKVG